MEKQLEHILKAEIDPAFARRASFILRSIEKQKAVKVLDIGCGRGFYVHALTAFPFIREIHGLDVNEKYLKLAKKRIRDPRVKLTKGNIYNLPYSDNYFDAVLATEVLEHLDDDKKALEELKRVVKPGGSILVSVPNFHFPFMWDPVNWILMKLFNTHVNKDIWWLAGIWADHLRLYTDTQLTDLTKRAGLKVATLEKYVHYCWPFTHFLLYGIGKNLVERMGMESFSRFNFDRRPTAEKLAMIFGLPAKFDTKQALEQSSMNIAAELKK